MKAYKAVVRNVTESDVPVIMEQPRPCLGKDFCNNAVAWAFLESCRGGIYANHIVVEITADEKPVCEFLLFSHMDVSRVWANLYIKRGNRLFFLRRMAIAE